MWAVTRSIKFQNKLAKEAIINALKSKSTDMFQDGMIIRAFTNVTENSIEIFHLFKNKEYVNKKDSDDSDTATIYFFYTVWCPHCKTAQPVWKSLKEKIGDKKINGVKLSFVDVDCDKDTDTADKFKVEGYPTIKLVKGNKVIEYDAKPDSDTLMQFLNTSL